VEERCIGFHILALSAMIQQRFQSHGHRLGAVGRSFQLFRKAGASRAWTSKPSIAWEDEYDDPSA